MSPTHLTPPHTHTFPQQGKNHSTQGKNHCIRVHGYMFDFFFYKTLDFAPVVGGSRLMATIV